MFNLRIFKSVERSSLQDRLITVARQALDQAAFLPPGPEQDALLMKASRANTAAHLDDWLSSPGLRPPT
jgi:hypothetical protein